MADQYVEDGYVECGYFEGDCDEAIEANEIQSKDGEVKVIGMSQNRTVELTEDRNLHDLKQSDGRGFGKRIIAFPNQVIQ